MDRTRRLADVWNWLPAFRAVAEAEHLPTAGERLHVTPAALSRSIRLLEDALDTELFDRGHRRITLNQQGKLLLESLRNGMRLLDDGLESAVSEEIRGPLMFSAPGPFASTYVVPAVVELTKRYPKVEPHIFSSSAAQAVRQLRSGQLDIALLDDPIGDAELRIEKFVDLEYGVYCGPGHALYRKRKLTTVEVLEHPFAAPVAGGDDHFPKEHRRRVSFHLLSLQHGVELCAAGACLAVLPDVIARRAEVSMQVKLRRLPVEGFQPAALYLVYRRPMGDGGRTGVGLEILKELVG